MSASNFSLTFCYHEKQVDIRHGQSTVNQVTLLMQSIEVVLEEKKKACAVRLFVDLLALLVMIKVVK